MKKIYLTLLLFLLALHFCFGQDCKPTACDPNNGDYPCYCEAPPSDDDFVN